MSTENKQLLNDLPAGAVTKNMLEDLPAEAETLSAEEAEQVAGGAISFAGTLDLTNPKPPTASGAMKTIAAAQTD